MPWQIGSTAMREDFKEREDKWKIVIGQVQERVKKLGLGHDDAQDLEGWLIEKLLRLDQRFPEQGIPDADKVYLRLWFVNKRIKDWFKSNSLRKKRFVPLMQKNIESGQEYESELQTFDAEFQNDEQYDAIENRDEAEVAERNIRYLIGKRGVEVLNIVKSMDTLDSTEIAEKLKCQPGAINTRFYSIRQKSKLLKFRDFD